MNQTNQHIQQGIKSIYAEQGDVFVTYGGVHRVPHALTPPPFLSETFRGRENDLERIHAQLFAPGDNLLLLINGEGGIGKTTLAAHYFHQYQHEYTHVAWILSEKNIVNALLLLAIPLNLEFDKQANTDERIELLLAALMNLEKPCLLVIDNANELPDLETNYQRLRRCSNFHLLLTTRIKHFEHAEVYAVNQLPKDQSLQLFEDYYRNLDDNEKSLFLQIRKAVGGNTLVLELLAKNLKSQNRLRQHYSLASLLADLQSKGLLELSHSQTVSTDYQSRGAMRRETPQAIISAMYDLSGLSGDEMALLSVFAILPAENIPFSILETLLPNLPQLDNGLLSLSQQGWIEFNEANKTFKCSPVIQEVTQQKNLNLRQDCSSIVDILIEKLAYEGSHLTGATYSDALLYARYGETVLLTFQQEPDKNLVVLSERIGTYYLITGNLQLALAFFEQFHRLVNELHQAFPQNVDFKNNMAISCERLGSTRSALGDLQQALTFFEQFHRLKNELHQTFSQNVDFKNGLAIACQYLGNTHSVLGDLQQALTFFEQSRRLVNELHHAFPQNVDFKNGLAISCQYLGNTHSALGDLQQALTFFEQFHRLVSELHQTFPQNVGFKNGLAISCEKLGNTHSALGDLQQALTFFEQSHQLENELHQVFPKNVDFKNKLAISCERLGNTHSALGDLQQALTFFEQSHRLVNELHRAFPKNVGFKNNLAISCERLGNTHSALGDLQQALTFFEQSHRLVNELHQAFPKNVGFKNNLALSYQGLGWLYEDKFQDLNQAKTHYHQSKRLLMELADQYPNHKAFKQNLDRVNNKLPAE